MILFLNFAPLEYLGGAERKTYELFAELRKKEKVVALTADHTLAGAYGKLVLNQPFEDRSKGSLHFKKGEREYVTLRSFIPWTREWKKVVGYIKVARRIYIKCDVNELLILLYFGGLKSFAKTVASVRSPWYYADPISFMDRFHNVVYVAWPMRFLLQKLGKIHVMTLRDQKLFLKYFSICDTIVIPNYTDEPKNIYPSKINQNGFDIVFIGELIVRKGIDIVLNVVKHAPKKYIFHIIGDGPMKKNVEHVAKEYPNCMYHGYLKANEVRTILRRSDVLFFPSRAEGFGGVVLEALSCGVPTITSHYVDIDIPEPYQFLSDNSIDNYLMLLEIIYAQKNMNRNKIITYSKNFLYAKIMPEMKKLLN